jgi:polysaccharide biosynthesis PFTS motif protein
MFSLREIAAKVVGAVTVSYHYSNQSDITMLHQDICDVFFVWGKKYEKGLAREHSAIGHLIQVGYIFDYTFNNLKNKSQIIRDTFRRNNISYVIGILDEYVGGNYAGPQLKAYRAILEYAEKHPNTGIIIKPKKEVSIRHLHSSAEVLKLISNLESQRRVMILDSQKYPVEAGQASDIVIGMIPDSTAGLECALAGVPTVIYDIFSMRSHPFYGWGYNRVIFDDIENLLNLLDINKDRPKSIPGFADWSPVLDTIDHFRDRRASERVGFYLKTLLLKLEEGMLKEEAINTTNKVYMNEFGHDKVTSL